MSVCPQCGGRKVISVGVHEIMCAECVGTGQVGTAKAPVKKTAAEKGK